ncbi:hypothetical protein [Streptomyces radicis]|uniref:hypothetical protein n=1 Tax=Streptomyces radicis TaxID=1750517 RepID=UPI0011C4737D|nr:hypothetical protein [Streptomyces radicis]
MKVAKENYSEERKLVNDVPQLAGSEALVARTLQFVQERTTAVVDAAVSLGHDPKSVVGWRLNVTEMIRDASKVAFAHDDPQPAQLGNGVVEDEQWSRPRPCHTRLRRIEKIATDRHGTRWAKAGASLKQVGTFAAAVMLLPQRAWHLWDQRMQSPAPFSS